MIVAAIANRTVDKARQAFVEAGVDEATIREVNSAEELAAVNASGCVPTSPQSILSYILCNALVFFVVGGELRRPSSR